MNRGLREELGYLGDLVAYKQILAGTYELLEEVDQYTKEILKELK